MFRIVLGLYLGYIAYSLLFGNEKEVLLEYPWLIFAGVFFMIAAALIVVTSWKQMQALKAQEALEDEAAIEEAERAREMEAERERKAAEAAAKKAEESDRAVTEAEETVNE